MWRGSCFGSWGFSVSLTGAGDCIAAPLPGTLSAHGDVAFAADRVAAVQIADTLEISASAGDKVIVLALAAQPGTYSCSDAYGPRIGYFRNTDEPLATLDFRSWRGVPAICSVTLAAAGAIGERVQGSFSATLLDWRTDGGTLALAGTFDVERGAY